MDLAERYRYQIKSAEAMETARKDEPWWAVPLLVLLLPFVIGILFFRGFYTIILYLLVWTCWLPRGRDLLVVYSDSPHWKNYFEEEILPHVQERAVVMNWSERRNWIERMSLGPSVFRHLGGDRDFNPIAIRFRPFRIHRTYRFKGPIGKWRKTDDRRDLDSLLFRFFADLKS